MHNGSPLSSYYDLILADFDSEHMPRSMIIIVAIIILMILIIICIGTLVSIFCRIARQKRSNYDENCASTAIEAMSEVTTRANIAYAAITLPAFQRRSINSADYEVVDGLDRSIGLTEMILNPTETMAETESTADSTDEG